MGAGKLTLTVRFDISASGFVVRSARPMDSKACRMLLPSLASDAEVLVALEGAQGLVIGAAGMTRSQRPAPLVGPGVMIHVIEPCRSHGVGRALCNALVSTARAGGAQALYAARRVEFDSHEMRRWEQLGFSVCETVEEHQLPVAEIVSRLEPIVEGVRSRGWIPDQARIVPLYAADREKVLELHLDELGGDRAALSQRLRGQGPKAFHLRFSRVLLLGERVVGCILGHSLARGAAAVDAVIVKPELRDGWANAWLRLEAARGALTQDISHLRFTTFDHYADTRSFAKRLRGVVTTRWALMHRPLG
jgi:GNAT superfamily N-acetyltransferase